MKQVFSFAAALLLSHVGPAWSQTPGESDDPAIQEAVVVTARQQAVDAGVLADTIQQTEIIDRLDLEATQSTVLSDALQRSAGVRVTNECSMCGVKRIFLNGLGGQHTTFLIDGLPAHTLLSGFYGPDALSIAGVERIDIARGAGASLTAPEAIGGTVNIITQEPDRTGLSLNGAAGEDEYAVGDAVATYTNPSGRLRALLAVQFDTRDQVDNDSNGVSENPFLENKTVSARLSFDPGADTTISLRAGYVDSEIFGGPMDGSIDETLRSFALDPSASANLFSGDDVRNEFIGKPWETTESILTTREEISGRLFHAFSADLNLDTGISWSRHEQDSFYEGFDYRATNDMLYLTGRTNWALSEDHLLTLGADRRDETLRSESDAAIGNPNFVSDSFNYLTTGLFVQDTWTPSDDLEVALAVRVDKVEADFIDPQKPGLEIDETLVSPRVDARFLHNELWASRISVGQGYRAPLSFFETDHGILDAGNGFQIDIDKLERSVSATYALSYAGARLTFTAGLAWTSVDNLAALDEIEVPTGSGNLVPLLSQRDETGTVFGGTLDMGYAATDTLDLTLTLEAFQQDEVMRSIFGIAPVEERAIIGAEWRPGAWDIHFDAILVGPRDLTDYGYEGFNDVAATLAKSTDADSFATFDARIERKFGDRFSLYAGGRNLLDYTQVNDADTPLFFDAEGVYDVAYIYGPLRGRELYAGIKVEF